MEIFDGDNASSMVFSGAEQPTQPTEERQSIFEEDQWELVQLAVERGILPVEQAEKLMYEFHTRVHHLGNTSLQAS